MHDHRGRRPACDKLWFVLDPEELLQGVFLTKREALKHALGPHDDGYVVHVRRAAPGDYSVSWNVKGDPADGHSFFVKRGRQADAWCPGIVENWLGLGGAVGAGFHVDVF